jgi:hypothetical protein
MGYDPLNLSALQIGIESGGHQFGPDGKPLTSKKGAVGIAQVMPDTGPEAAALAGVPWDENRYKNDRDYNLQIGDAYQKHLNTIFNGHQVAATAAYNAGPTRVLKLRQKYGDSWAQHLPDETKVYVKHVLGVDVDQNGGNENGSSDFINSIAKTLDPYTVGNPTAGEGVANSSGQNFPIATPSGVDTKGLSARANSVPVAADNYSAYLQTAIEPLRQNQAAQVDQLQKIAGVKHNLTNDFAVREADLESKITPLMAAKQKLLDNMQELDNLHPLDRRLKAVFNPQRYDPRMIRGQIERLDERIKGYESNYSDLNTLRSGVAAASVDAEDSDRATLAAAHSNTLADIQLLGQVVDATKAQTSAALFPLSTQVDTMRLQEFAKQSFIGKQSVEELTSLYQKAQASPDGKINVDGIDLTVGDLQTASRQGQEQDLTFRSMVNASKAQDAQTADQLETRLITHMTPEQLGQAMKEGGMYQGRQLNLPKLTEAFSAAQQGRQAMVDQTITNTAQGLADQSLRNLSGQIDSTKMRVVEMFGNMPGEFGAFQRQTAATYHAWRQGFDQAVAAGTGNEYVARTMPTITAMSQNFETTVGSIAKQWGGGNDALTGVANAYLRGNPVSGDTAIKGLVAIARSGMPAGSKLSGPAAQAVEAARSIVREWDNPQAGDSLQAVLKSGQKKETDLYRLIQGRVSAIYADSVTDAIIKDFPALARGVRDPNNPGQAHPFNRVSREDFITSVQHGDAQGYAVVGQQMGVNASVAKQILASGVDGQQWKDVAKAKGWGNDKYQQIVGALQSIQMSETLSALDASHSAHPGFSPAKAYVDFLQTPQVKNRIDQAVNGYGQSSFGAYLVSSSAGGGYRDAWDAYTQATANQYFLNHGKDLQQRIDRQRSMGGDPFVRFDAVNRAAGLSRQESQVLLQATKPLVNMTQPSNALDVKDSTGSTTYYNANNFDQIANVIRNHKFDDPTVEKIRKRAAAQWDAMDAVVGNVFDAVSN